MPPTGNDTPLPPRRRGRPPKAQIEQDDSPQPRKRLRTRSTPPVAATNRVVTQGKKRKATNESPTIDQRISDALLEALVSLPISSSSRPDRTDSPQLHRCTCDNCEWHYFTCIRFKCAVCEDYDLCSPCYNRNIHDVTHPFMRITKPGGKPTYLPARCKLVSRNTASSGTTAKPASSSASQPLPASEQVTSPDPFFYNTMSTADIKSFLTEHGVEFGDALDNETLCRRAWDTHCDCMTFAELNTFLSGRNITTVECRDVNSRRQKAKDAFEPPSATPPTSSNTSTIQFRTDDMVVLTGLNRVPMMNGKMAKVISVNDSERKALVRVEVLDQTFKVKLENLKMQDDGEEVEELE